MAEFKDIRSSVSSTEEPIMSIPYLHATETRLLKQVVKDLFRHEGFREYAYPDTLSKLHKKYPNEKWGFRPARDILLEIGISYSDALEMGAPWTYGVGFAVGVTPDHKITEQRAMRILEEKILETHAILTNILPWYKASGFVTHTVLINMAFNLGIKGLLGFKNTLEYMKQQKWYNASANMRKSLWYRQVRSRAEELARRIETQEIPTQYASE